MSRQVAVGAPRSAPWGGMFGVLSNARLLRDSRVSIQDRNPAAMMFGISGEPITPVASNAVKAPYSPPKHTHAPTGQWHGRVDAVNRPQVSVAQHPSSRTQVASLDGQNHRPADRPASLNPAALVKNENIAILRRTSPSGVQAAAPLSLRVFGFRKQSWDLGVLIAGCCPFGQSIGTGSTDANGILQTVNGVECTGLEQVGDRTGFPQLLRNTCRRSAMAVIVPARVVLRALSKVMWA